MSVYAIKRIPKVVETAPVVPQEMQDQSKF
jgi:hypothetical protein